MNSIILRAPAKVNTFLKVVGRRDDGYHELEMVMVPLSLHDTVILEKSSGEISFSQEGLSDEGMKGEKNLCSKIASLFKHESGTTFGVKIHLIKRIPLAAGLGGGSSDAASVLMGLNLLWDVKWDRDRLSQLGCRLGADIPFFCYGKPSFVHGIGDKVEPVENFPNLSILLINPGISLSTRTVYENFDLRLTATDGDASVRRICDPNFGRVFKGLEDVCSSLTNDLESVAIKFYPEIQEIKDYLVNSGAKGVMMSGSGSTVFGIFDNMEEVSAANEALPRLHWTGYAVKYDPSLNFLGGNYGDHRSESFSSE
ncbi:MAG: 4-(cytidine 5'-diphospho)-2-C-methyl-D-erythritol kinase [Pseudomonadota bacterium]